MNKTDLKTKAATAVTAAMLFALPAGAQSWGNLPYMAQNTLLYPLTRLFGVPYNYNMTNPYYLMNNAINQSAINNYGAFRAPGYGAMPMGVSNYTDEEPLNNPRQRVRPFRFGQFGMDQKASAVVATPGASAANGANPNSANPNSAAANAAGSVQSNGGIAPNATQANQPMQPTVSTTMPPVAPQRSGLFSHHGSSKHSRKNQQQQNTAAAAPSVVAQQGASAPLATGFVNMVNSKYDGDIGKALFNPDSRAWAHAVGLVDNNEIFGADLSQTRVSLMSGIMKDPNLDSVSKIDAIKILLRGGTAATPIAGAAAAAK